MKVECERNRLDADFVKSWDLKLGDHVWYNTISVGSVYEVIGMTVNRRSHYYGDQPTVYIVDDDGSLLKIPLCMFRIVDPKPSPYWLISFHDAGIIYLWPEVFYRPYFHDDLSNDEEGAIKGYKELLRLFQIERSNNSGGVHIEDAIVEEAD